MKKLSFDSQARKNLAQGVEILYNAVGSTLGPKSGNVTISRDFGVPLNVHDGVTVARYVEDRDEFVQQGIKMAYEAAANTNADGGDGTTTATLLTHFLVRRGMELIDKGVNGMVLRSQLVDALAIVKEAIKGMATQTSKLEDITRVAIISAGDVDLGTMVAAATHKMGKQGIVTADDSKTTVTEVEYAEGMQINRGFSSSFFMTDPDRQESHVSNAAVIVCEKRLSFLHELLPLMEQVVQHTKDVVIFGDVSGDAIRFMIENKLRGTINALVVSVPGNQAVREENLRDIAMITGAKVLDRELGLDNDEMKVQFDTNWLGRADRIVANKDTCRIIGGKGDKAMITDRVETLEKLMEGQTSLFEKERLAERLAKLSTGVAVIRVGGKTEIEAREKKERVIDAIGASRAVLDEGIVPGGGVTFLKLQEYLSGRTDHGSKLLSYALEQPMRKLLENSGLQPRSPRFYELLWTHDLVDAVREEFPKGYEVLTGKKVNMMDAGVIDPAKVIRLCLENAVSVAGSILTTGCQIVIEREETHA